MLSEYLILIISVVSLVLALLFLFFCLNLLPGHDFGIEEDEEQKRRVRLRILLCSAALSAAFAYLAYYSANYLVEHAPRVLWQFGQWYGLGFLSRLVLLYHRRKFLDRSYGTDWGEVFASFFIALLGPIETLVLIKCVYFEKSPY